jgi:hypothetical protein
MKNGFGYLIVTAFFVIVLLWVLSQKPNNTVEDTRPEFELTASQLSLDFYHDESLANQNYLNKIISVEGEILKVTSNTGKKEIWLKGTPNGYDLRCLLSNRLDQRTVFQNSEKIRLKCVCTGLTDKVELMQCEEW